MKDFILEKNNRLFLIFYFCLSFTSIVSIFLAQYNNNQTSLLFLKQLIFFLLGLYLIYIIQKISIFKYEKISILFFIISIILLVILLLAPNSIAPTVNGAKGWFNFKIFSLQPSEFAKISSVMLFSYIIVQPNFRNSSDFLKLLQISIITFIPFILIVKENDIGNALFFIFLFFILIFLVSNNRKTFLRIYMVSFIIIIFIIGSAIYFPKLLSILGLQDYQIKRVLSWINPSAFKYDYSYQITTALNEVKLGGLTGSFEKNSVFVSEQYNDFIITVIAKNFGFVGVTIFIIFYLLFILKILNLSRQCLHGNFSYYFLLLTAFSFSFSFIINTYSATGIIPVIGISMPFISYGGSSLLANSLLFGIVMNINNTIYQERLQDEYDYINNSE